MRRFLNALGAAVVLAAGSTALLTGRAGAAPCDPGTPTTSDCTVTATANLGAGTLTLAAPASLTWAATLNGHAQSVVDTTAADQQYEINDATGATPAAGWHVTTSATTFTSGANTLPDNGTFETNGSTASEAGVAPTASCVTAGTCTLPTNTVTTYPVLITTAATTPTAFTIYGAAGGTGVGDILIGGSTAANPVGWWLNVPPTAAQGVYTSTVTMAIVSGP